MGDDRNVESANAAEKQVAALSELLSRQWDDRPAADAASRGAGRTFETALRGLTLRVCVTPALLVLNIALFMGLVISAHDVLPSSRQLLAWGANFGPKTLAGEWWRLVTNAFVHVNPVHFGFNLWMLWSVGRIVESREGNLSFALLYFVSAIGGSIASLAWDPTVVTGGGSGALLGVCGAFMAHLFTRRIVVPAEILSQLKRVMIAFLVYVVFGFFVQGIDNAMHVGGLGSGFVCGLLLRPIEMETARTYLARITLAGGVAAGLLSACVWMLPAAPLDIHAEYAQFLVAERKLIDEYGQLAGRFKAKELSDAAMADEVERNILPRWSILRRQTESWHDAPLVNIDFVSHLSKTMRIREEAWPLLIDGLRQQDKALIDQFNTKWAEAKMHADSSPSTAE